MPLGNLTSQFFANVYLNELDQFVKRVLRVKYYIHYVDDFVIFHNDETILEEYKSQITEFLKENLLLTLHPQKCKITELKQGVAFLGFRVFPNYKLLRKMNLRKMKRKFGKYKSYFDSEKMSYDAIYEYFQGWFAYACWADTYKLRKQLCKQIEEYFPNEISATELNRLEKYL